jgi:hypothetical protein
LSVAKGSITYVYDSNNILVGEFPSQRAAIKEYNISKGSIYRYLDSKKLWTAAAAADICRSRRR